MTDLTKNEEAKTSCAAAGRLEQIVIRHYTQGGYGDGSAILCDGLQLTVDEITDRLNALEEAASSAINWIDSDFWDINENNTNDPLALLKNKLNN